MNRLALLLVVVIFAFGCKKIRNCYECETVTSSKVHFSNNTYVSYKSSTSEEFCGKDDEVTAHEESTSYENDSLIVKTNCSKK